MSGAVTHLLPGVQAMAIRAKQSQVASVRSPIAEAIIPHTCPAFIPQLFRGVDVVNVENAIIVLATHNAASPKAFNQRQFSTPITRVLVRLKAMFVPMVFATLLGAKPMFAFKSTSLTSRLSFPSSGQIASLSAVFASPVFEAIEMHFKLLLAVGASHCDRCLFHYRNILHRAAKVKFDIACKRIEDAQRQGDLFIEGAAA